MDYTETLHDTPRRQARFPQLVRSFALVLGAILRAPPPPRPDPQEERMLLIARHRPPI